MNHMFARFSKETAQVFIIAQEEAKAFGHTYVGTEHILLALVKVGSGGAYYILSKYGLTPSIVEKEIEIIVGRGQTIHTDKELAITPRVKKVIQTAYEEARILGSNNISTEHILLGMTKEGEGIASHILQKLGLKLELLRKEIVDMLSGERQSTVHSAHATDAKIMKELEGFGVDLSRLAEEGKLDPVIGREKEIERMMQILVRRKKSNPVLIGDPGVGKTAIVEGLAQKIARKDVPELLLGKRIFSLDLASLVAGTKYRGEFEKRLKGLLNILKSNKAIILFVDEIHNIVGAGAAEGAIDASSIFKPPLARGEIKFIGATTVDEYRKYIEKDSALERRFQKIYVSEPTVEETIDILRGLRPLYENFHNVKYTDECLRAAVELSYKYITDHHLPDKAIDVLDEAGARAKLKLFSLPSRIKIAQVKLNEIKKRKDRMIDAQDYEQAAEMRDFERELEGNMDEMMKLWHEEVLSEKRIVDVEEIGYVVSKWTGIPLAKLEESEVEKLLNMEEALHRRVVGQEEAINAVSRAIRRARAGLKDPRRPVGSFIFLGPTGVGKTELAKTLAEYLFGDENALIRIDMSEYMERFTVSRLTGAPPGYVGYEEAGELTEKVRRKPFSVVLLDEIEKAHPDVFNILLQILDEGRLTDSQGRVVDFKNTILIMTSNIGARLINREKRAMGFVAADVSEESSYESMKQVVMAEVKKVFRPEFLNRLDETIVFHSLTREDVEKIIDIMMRDMEKRSDSLGVKIVVTKPAKDFLINEGYNPIYGARPLRRTIQKYVEDPLSEELLRNRFGSGDTIVVAIRVGKIAFLKAEKETVDVLAGDPDDR